MKLDEVLKIHENKIKDDILGIPKIIILKEILQGLKTLLGPDMNKWE